MRRFVATFVASALLMGGCSTSQESPSAPPSSSKSVTASPSSVPRRQLPNLSPPTDESVAAFGDILVEWTLGLDREDRVRPKFPYFNVDPDSSTCPGPNNPVISAQSGTVAGMYCSDGTFMYSLGALRARAKAEPDEHVVMEVMSVAFQVFIVNRLRDRNAKAPELTDANYAFCATGYVHGGLMKGRYIRSEADLDWDAVRVYASNLSAQRVYANARDNGECRDPGPVGESQPGDRANVDVPDICSLVDKNRLQQMTGATRDLTSQGDQSGRTDKAPLCRMVFQGDAGRWEATVIKLENNVAAMQFCESERAGSPAMKVFERSGGVVQAMAMGSLDTIGVACIRNYGVTLAVTGEGWGVNKMVTVLDAVETRVNSHA